MLKLENIVKDYGTGDNIVHALKGLTLSFRPCEFVSILGPSGCGKTTFLNIIGGLDRYTSGDLIINGKSTKNYTDRDWDTYRNKSIGFVFQSYNLIPHLNVLENVVMALSLSGISGEESKKRAEAVLKEVGLEDKITKKPSELSGGQMQRVAIARALVNNPDIILADEPTGALDTDTGLAVMEILKKVASTRLVIMVTHNPQLAQDYSTRIIRMLDGKIIGDTSPLSLEEEKKNAESDEEKSKSQAALSPKERKALERKSSMSVGTTIKLSAKNLLTKKRRSIVTSFACSIGVIGMAIILSVSNGANLYMNETMAKSTSVNYLSVSTTYVDYASFMTNAGTKTTLEEYPEETTGVIPYTASFIQQSDQNLSDEYIDYLKTACQNKTIALDYTYSVSLHAMYKNNDGTYAFASGYWDQILDNSKYIGTQYKTLASQTPDSPIPDEEGEAALVVDHYNRLSTTALKALGISYDETNLTTIKYDDLLGKEYKVVMNDQYYTEDTSVSPSVYRAISSQSQLGQAYSDSHSVTVKIISVLRAEKTASTDWISNGIGYSPKLSAKILSEDKNSAVAQAQYKSSGINVTTGAAFTSTTGSGANTYKGMLGRLGYTSTPSTITVYPKDFNAKKEIIASLDKWNEDHAGSEAVVKYTDMSSLITSSLGTLINIVTYVLVAFSAISLVISSIMIALIIYASVIERVREIGILRAMGARKKDISRIFRTEAIILGALSGTMALLFALLDNSLINVVLFKLVQESTIASMTWIIALAMMALAVVLPLIASLIPASLAAKKDPVVALRAD
jgi:putative ABC transport system permease protein